VNYNGLLSAARRRSIVVWSDSMTLEVLKLCKDSRGNDVIMASAWYPWHWRQEEPWHVIHVRKGNGRLRNSWRVSVITRGDAFSIYSGRIFNSTYDQVAPELNRARRRRWNF